MPGIGIGVSFVINEEPLNGLPCSACGGFIVTKVNRLYLSLDTSLSETGFELIDTKKQYCTPCKPEL